MLIDSHCHLDRLDLSLYDGKLSNVLDYAKANNVQEMLCVSIDLATFPAMLDTIKPFNFIHASCGQHPLHQNHQLDGDLLRQLAADDRVVAIGETGLDNFYAPETHDIQRDSFIEHVAVATELNKPLIIHTRDARDETIKILQDGQAHKVGGVLHCFTETLAMAEQAIDMGFYISISGIVTFNNAAKLREVVKALPLERLLVETDSPYLAPAPHRGKENQPAFVHDVAKYIAELKQVSLAHLSEVTTNNFRQLFIK